MMSVTTIIGSLAPNERIWSYELTWHLTSNTQPILTWKLNIKCQNAWMMLDILTF